MKNTMMEVFFFWWALVIWKLGQCRLLIKVGHSESSSVIFAFLHVSGMHFNMLHNCCIVFPYLHTVTVNMFIYIFL